jgi:hypothetical protein
MTLPRILLLPAALIATAVLAPRADAQIMRAIQRKAADAVAQKAEAKLDAKIEQMAEKAVNGSYDALFGGLESGAGAMIKLPGDAKTAERYSFSIVSTMTMSSTSASGKDEGTATMKMHFNPAEQYTATQVISQDLKDAGGNAVVIFDLENEAMVMLMEAEGNKFSMAYSFKDAAAAAEKAGAADDVNWDETESWKNWTRIGTRTIAGYSATGYRSTDGETTVEMWVTRDPALAGAGLFGVNSGLKQLRGRLPEEYPTGMLLEMTSKDGKGQTSRLVTTEIDTRASVRFTMADYPRMGLGGK